MRSAVRTLKLLSLACALYAGPFIPSAWALYVGITAPSDSTVYTAPAAVQITAVAYPASYLYPIVKVEFFQGETLIGTSTTEPYGITWSNVPAGSYVLSAVVTDSRGETRETGTDVDITVNPGSTLGGGRIYYIVPDHLNTPRLIEDSTGTMVWRWDQREPFGNDVPNNNPSGAGAFDFPLRFPGQYFDRETNLVHNYFRDYDIATGRYVESDPIGLRAGLNTYAYVSGRPLTYVDLLGLMGNSSGGPSRPSPYCGPRPTVGCVPTPPPPEPAPLTCEEHCKETFETCKKLVDWFPTATAVTGAVAGRGLGSGGSVAGGVIGSVSGMNQGGLYLGCQAGYERCKERCSCENTGAL